MSTPRCRWPSRPAACPLPRRCSPPCSTTGTATPAPGPGPAAGGLAGIQVLHAADRTNYPLMAAVDDRGDGFAVTAQAVAPAVPEQVCALLVTALDGLVTALEQAPATPLHQVAVLERGRAEQLLVRGGTIPPRRCRTARCRSCSRRRRRGPRTRSRWSAGGAALSVCGAGCAGEPAGALPGRAGRRSGAGGRGGDGPLGGAGRGAAGGAEGGGGVPAGGPGLPGGADRVHAGR